MSIKKIKYSVICSGIISLSLFYVSSFNTSAQDAVYSQFMFDALSVNPGLAGINNYNKVTVGFRDQWVQMPHAYLTYFASYDQNIELINSGIGVQIYRDVSGGIYSRTSGELYYSYHFQLANKIVVSPGLQLALVQRSFDSQGLTGPDPNTPLLLENRSNLFPDFGFGTVINFSDRLSFGVAAHHLNGPPETLSEINDKKTPLSLSAHFISYFPLNFGKFKREQFVISPGAYFRTQQYQNFLSVGTNIAYDPVFVGIWMRVSAFAPEAAIFMVGLEMYDFRIVYNFDYKLANAKSEFPGTGAHEITLTWKIHPPKQMRTIKCSKFSLSSMSSSKRKY